MTSAQRRIVFALCIIVGVTYLVGAGLTFTLAPMMADLGLSDDQGDLALAIPAVASLFIVFVVGRLGDQLGHRRIIMMTSAFFILGAIVLAAAQGFVMVAIGLLLAGAAATGLQIVTFGLLQTTFPSGKSRVSAFTSFGMMFPLVYVGFPVLTGRIMEYQSWRVSPLIWAAFGVIIPIVAWFMLSAHEGSKPVGELLTPILAGVGLAAIASVVNRGSAYGWTSLPAMLALLCAVLSLLACALILRSKRAHSISLATLRSPGMVLLLVAGLFIALVDTLVYVTLGVQYLFSTTSLQAAWALVPAQIGAVIGAKWIASWMMNRFGIARSGNLLLVIFALSMLTLFVIQQDSPMWVAVSCITLFAVFGMAAFTVVNTAIMGLAPEGEAGMVSSYRSAAEELGMSFSVVVLGSGMVAAANASASSGVADVADIVTSFHWTALIGFAVIAVAFVAYFVTARRHGHLMVIAD